jgi:hypothetical protein
MRSERVGIHNVCWKFLLDRTIPPRNVTLEVVAQCLSQRVYCSGRLAPGATFGEATKCRGLGWFVENTSDEWLVANPADCPEMKEYAQHLPEASGAEGPRANHTMKADNNNSRLNLLPPELLLRVLCFLPRQDALNFRISSRTIAAIPLVQEFWKSRILDTPYLWEIHDHLPELGTIRPDWRKIYKDLVVGEPVAVELGGLRNRKRIWKLLSTVAEECWEGEMMERKQKGSYVDPAKRAIDGLPVGL